MNRPELIVMLTHNDITVPNAYEIFRKCRNSDAICFGFKEIGLPIDKMKRLYDYMKENKKITFLEVVTYTEEESMNGARIAHECGCDILMGTTFSDDINSYCKDNHIKYMPFVGDIHDRPSILTGSIESMIDEAHEYIHKGVFGIDLLGYRYQGDATKLNKEFVKNVDAPVCIAGSINSYERLDEIKDANPEYFTIGGAFFENKFDGSFNKQINKVVKYMKK